MESNEAFLSRVKQTLEKGLALEEFDADRLMILLVNDAIDKREKK